jgi:hypothetical protein
MASEITVVGGLKYADGSFYAEFPNGAMVTITINKETAGVEQRYFHGVLAASDAGVALKTGGITANKNGYLCMVNRDAADWVKLKGATDTYGKLKPGEVACFRCELTHTPTIIADTGKTPEVEYLLLED